MSDGTISNNSITGSIVGGGGVNVSEGEFSMSGGTISNNSISADYGAYGGGVGVVNGGTFTMKGGFIRGNSISSTGGGDHVVFGGGVGVYSGTFTKKDDGDSDSGIIYGSDAIGTYMDKDKDENDVEKDLKNTSTAGPGHAAYVNDGSKKRDETAGENYDLDSTKDKDSGGGWD
jgi:hypothetical protein